MGDIATRSIKRSISSINSYFYGIVHLNVRIFLVVFPFFGVFCQISFDLFGIRAISVGALVFEGICGGGFAVARAPH